MSGTTAAPSLPPSSTDEDRIIVLERTVAVLWNALCEMATGSIGAQSQAMATLAAFSQQYSGNQ